MRAVGVATSTSFFRKKAKNKRKKQAVQMLRTGNIYGYTNLRDDWSGITNAGEISSNREDTFAYVSYSSKVNLLSRQLIDMMIEK